VVSAPRRSPRQLAAGVTRVVSARLALARAGEGLPRLAWGRLLGPGDGRLPMVPPTCGRRRAEVRPLPSLWPGCVVQLGLVVLWWCECVVCHHNAQLSPLGVNRRSERMVLGWVGARGVCGVVWAGLRMSWPVAACGSVGLARCCSRPASFPGWLILRASVPRGHWVLRVLLQQWGLVLAGGGATPLRSAPWGVEPRWRSALLPAGL
jgi:hypothetical protein